MPPDAFPVRPYLCRYALTFVDYDPYLHYDFRSVTFITTLGPLTFDRYILSFCHYVLTFTIFPYLCRFPLFCRFPLLSAVFPYFRRFPLAFAVFPYFRCCALTFVAVTLASVVITLTVLTSSIDSAIPLRPERRQMLFEMPPDAFPVRIGVFGEYGVHLVVIFFEHRAERHMNDLPGVMIVEQRRQSAFVHIRDAFDAPVEVVALAVRCIAVHGHIQNAAEEAGRIRRDDAQCLQPARAGCFDVDVVRRAPLDGRVDGQFVATGMHTQLVGPSSSAIAACMA